MANIKLRAPGGVDNFSHDGIEYSVDDGAVEVPHQRVADALAAHGFVAFDAPSIPVEKMTREQMLAEQQRRSREKLSNMSDEDIRADLARDEPASHAEDKAERKVGEEDTVEDIKTMSRPQLFAYLKVKGVAALPSHKDDQLRQMALDAHKD